MADVLELDNAEDFEVDDEGDRKSYTCTMFYIFLNWKHILINKSLISLLFVCCNLFGSVGFKVMFPEAW